jgi:hypothetical protein
MFFREDKSYSNFLLLKNCIFKFDQFIKIIKIFLVLDTKGFLIYLMIFLIED